MEQAIIYLLGPRISTPDGHFPALAAAAERARQAGWEVVGADDPPGDAGFALGALRLVECDGVALLPEWEKSPSDRLLYLLARELRLEVVDAETLEPPAVLPQAAVVLTSRPTESICDEAKRLTSVDRQGAYGHPTDDFGRTAQMWNGILSPKLREGVRISPMDVPLCLIAVKLAREAHRHGRDNLVDICGYSRTAAMVAGDE